MSEFPQACPRTNPRGRGGHRDPYRGGRPATEVAWEGPTPGETTDIVPRLHAATAAHGPTEQGKNARLWAKSAITVVDLDTSQKYVGRGQTIKIVKRLQSNT